MRAPYQVLVIPYQVNRKEILYAIFKRSDMICWQWIAGGGEDFDESIIVSAKREAFEEACIPSESKYIELDTRTSIPVESICGEFLWGKDVYVINEFSFGVKVEDEHLKLSDEHTEYRWINYTDALKLLKYDSNKTALWELNVRLTRNY